MDNALIPSGQLLETDDDAREAALVGDLGALLDRAVAGDLAAAAAVYDRVAVSVYRLVHVVVGDGELATAVCRLGYEHLWKAWSAVADGAHRPVSARSWTHAVMHRFASAHVA
jgi:hypothetical protein